MNSRILSLAMRGSISGTLSARWRTKKFNVMPVVAADGRFVGTLVRRDARRGYRRRRSELTAGDFCRKGLSLQPLDARESAIEMLERPWSKTTSRGRRREAGGHAELLGSGPVRARSSKSSAVAAAEVFPTEISERDDMLNESRAIYWNIGLSGLRSVKWAMSTHRNECPLEHPGPSMRSRPCAPFPPSGVSPRAGNGFRPGPRCGRVLSPRIRRGYLHVSLRPGQDRTGRRL